MPGTAVAEEVLAQIDGNRDDIISPAESTAYLAMLKRDLLVQLDRRSVALKPTRFEFPTPAELRSGWAFIQLEFSGTPGPFAAGKHSLVLENRHLPSVSVYLVNALQPDSSAIQISKQNRNENQSRGEIEFSFTPPPNSSNSKGMVIVAGGMLLMGAGLGGVLWRRRSQSRRPRPTERRLAG